MSISHKHVKLEPHSIVHVPDCQYLEGKKKIIVIAPGKPIDSVFQCLNMEARTCLESGETTSHHNSTHLHGRGGASPACGSRERTER